MQAAARSGIVVNLAFSQRIEAGQTFLPITGDMKMIKTLLIAISALAFSSVAFAAAHTGAPTTPPSKEAKTAAKPAGSETKDAAGQTEKNRENKMSPTGQNETSSVGATKPEGSGASGAKMK